jgi:hypothetical protein
VKILSFQGRKEFKEENFFITPGLKHSERVSKRKGEGMGPEQNRTLKNTPSDIPSTRHHLLNCYHCQ